MKKGKGLTKKKWIDKMKGLKKKRIRNEKE